MYFVDFTSYELLNKSVTGEIYKKYSYGPIPVNFYKILESMNNKKLINSKDQPAEYIPASITPLSKADYSLFTDKEMELIDVITDKYRNSTAGELETIAQSEAPYNMVNFDEVIPYHLAFYRNSFGEMDVNDNPSRSH